MQEPKVILAKTPKDPENPQPAETLVGHSQATVESFDAIFGTLCNPARLTARWLHFFKLDSGEEEFLTNAFAACALHDIGKANSGFQEAVNGRDRQAQLIRHEHLSGLILMLPDIWDWLKSMPGLNPEVVICAVIGHHLKTPRESFGQKLIGDLHTFYVYVEGIRRVMELLANRNQISLPQIDLIPKIWSFRNSSGYFSLGSHRNKVLKTIDAFRRNLKDSETLLRQLIAVRAALIVADSAGSGLMREGKDIHSWLRESFDESLIIDGQAVDLKVIQPRITQIAHERNDFQWHHFQNAAEHLSRRTLLVASCGIGKTLAAWRWIKGQASQSPASRIIFLYPTRGTATEGFRDYVAWAPEAEAALIHGSSAFELEGMFENCKDSRGEKDFMTEDRLFALGYWQRRIFSGTVDQFLGFMQHVYRSICLLPLLVDSIVVFDEVHSFDHPLFSAFKRFLKEFDVPVLCMTASLPPNRRQDLEECGLDICLYSQESSQMPRYSVNVLESDRGLHSIVDEALSEGKRVLWVVNTVSRCQRLAMELGVLCYHSRFKLDDRKKHHNKVIRVFKQGGKALLAITTQVCEMSLDLDADVLITEVAPITSLIQRMGRCNRHSLPSENKLGTVLVYPPENNMPYSEDELAGVNDFLQQLPHTASQSDLEGLLERCAPRAVEVERYAAFLESGPWAKAREESLREDDQFTEQAVLDCDIEEYLELRKENKPTDGLIISVPRRFAKPDVRLGYLRVAPSSHYHPQYGFLNNPQEVVE